MTRPNSSMPLGSHAAPAVRTVVLLPEVDTYVDPANRTTPFGGQNLVVSSDNNNAAKVAYVRFDLGPIPPASTITACRFYFTISGTVTKQVVVLALVDDDTWPETITFDSAPKPTTTHIGTWEAQREPRVTTSADNPVLVGAVQTKIGAGQDRKLSLQISSTSGSEGAATSNSYYSFAAAQSSGQYAAAPRLVVQYQPAPRLLARDWAQRQADARHSGCSPWTFANTPTKSYQADTVSTGVQLSSAAVIRDELLYLFTPPALMVVDPAVGALNSLISVTEEFTTLALGPDRLLYAASKSHLAVFDLVARKQLGSLLPLSNLSSAILAGADGSAYLMQGSILFAYVRHGETLAPAWSKDLGTTPTSQPTLSADGTIAYVAAANCLYALYTADGSEKWSYSLPNQAKNLTTPVAAGASGLAYFGVDNQLYVFGDIGTPKNSFKGSGFLSQPVIAADDTLYVLQGTELYTVSGDKRVNSVTIPGIAAKNPVTPAMDGAGNLFIVDNKSQLFVYKPDLTPGNSPQTFNLPSQPSLQVAPNGSLFIQSGSALCRIKPGVADAVTVSSYADATSYRAKSALSLAGAALPAAASVIFQSGGTVSIATGFSVPKGTEAVFNTGY